MKKKYKLSYYKNRERFKTKRGELRMLKQHRFWAALMVISSLMCLWTGHRMIHPKKKTEE